MDDREAVWLEDLKRIQAELEQIDLVSESDRSTDRRLDMTMFANCREKLRKDAYPFHKGADDEPNPYWEGNLNDSNKDVIRYGFDIAAHEADTYFYNLEVGALGSYLSSDELNIIAKYMAEREDDEPIPDDAPRLVKIIMAIREGLADWLEMERNQYITSLLDDQAAAEDNADAAE